MSDRQAINRRAAVRLGLFGGVAGVGAAAAAVAPAQARSLGGIESVSRAELQQATTGERNPDLYFLDEGAASGFFHADPQATDPVDDLGVHVLNRSGLAHRRVTSGGQTFDVQDFGAVGDGVADDTAAIRAAIAAVDTGSGYRTILFPPAIHYRTTETITFPERVDVVMETPIRYDGPGGTAAVVVGREGVNNVAHLTLQVVRDLDSPHYAEWEDENDIGLLIHNAYIAFLEIPRVEGFTIGVQARGSGAGFGYCHVHLGLLRDNRVALDLAGQSIGNTPGWVNENIWYGGNFSRRTATNKGRGNIGIRIQALDERYTRNNNNLFVKPCFELGGPSASPEKALPILIQNGRWNRFVSCRNENNNVPVMRTENLSLENHVSVGRGSVQVEDLGDYPTSVFDCVYDLTVQSDSQPLHAISSLREAATPYNEEHIQLDGLSWYDPQTGEVSHHGSASLSASSLVLTEDDHGLGVRVDLRDEMNRSTRYNWNRLVARAGLDTEQEGGLYVVCLDADGQVMSPPEGEQALVAGREGCIFTWTADRFGGAYLAGGSGAHPEDPYDWSPAAPADATYVAVHPSVAAVRLVWWARPERDLGIRSIAVSTPDLRQPPTGPEITTTGRLAVQVPAAGVWRRGTFVHNDLPDIVDGQVIQGWLKVSDAQTNALGADWVEVCTAV